METNGSDVTQFVWMSTISSLCEARIHTIFNILSLEQKNIKYYGNPTIFKFLFQSGGHVYEQVH